jgi:signal transduction histidine kinase/CheY-like chemotaxis protein
MIQLDKPILYVDDTEEQRYAICRILEREGYRPVQAATGAAALERVHPELLAVVLDVKLPDMSGYEVCRRIKQNPLYASTPIIQVSASFADPDHRAIGLSGGADAYIAQPVHPQELLNVVRSLIRSSQAELMLRFMAEIGPRITRSLDLQETRQAVEASVPPYFADRCELVLLEDESSGLDPTSDHTPDHSPGPVSDLGPGPIPDQPPLLPALEALARQAVSRSLPQLGLFDDGSSAIAAPLGNAGKHLGVALFVLQSRQRTYTGSDLVHAGDLADRIALALDNARLHTAQRNAQAALIQSEKLAAAGRLSAAIAHELNNPLEAITNLLFLIETTPELPETARNYAREALSELERLSHITRQSLGFYRELTTAQDFNVSENVQDTLSLYSRRLAAKGISITTDYDQALTVHAIRGEIRQVLSNLIVNAMDAMESGGLLAVSSFRSPRDEAVVSVRDSGSGIDKKIESRIFEPFFTTKPGTGTGLGLWVSDTIMRKHNGRLEFRTEHQGPGRGTTMYMILPSP